MLEGIGDPSIERSFSMCLTHCRHRAVSDDELARLPPAFFAGRARDLAGGPLVVHWTRGIAPVLSAEPCEHVRLEPHPQFGGEFPVDCGECPPCRARLVVEATGMPCALTREQLA